MKLRRDKDSKEFDYSNFIVEYKKDESKYKVSWKPSFALADLKIRLYKSRRVPLISNGIILSILMFPITIFTTLLSIVYIFIGKYALSGANFIRKERLNKYDRIFNWFTLSLLIVLVLIVIIPKIFELIKRNI